MSGPLRRGAGRPPPADDGTQARTAFVKSWFRSLFTGGRQLSDDELLDAARRLVAYLESVKASTDPEPGDGNVHRGLRGPGWRELLRRRLNPERGQGGAAVEEGKKLGAEVAREVDGVVRENGPRRRR